MLRVSLVLLTGGMLACSGALTSPDGGTTTPPTCDSGTISITSNIPSCIWPPNHEMVLFNINDLNITATGGCAVPTLSIVSVTDNQSEHGGGSGNTSPDYTFNSSGVCLRAERDGRCNSDRVYTITVQATDGTTTIDDTITVTVPHDQDEDGGCPNVDPSRIVPDGDPACN